MKLGSLKVYLVAASLGAIFAAPAFAQNVSQHTEQKLQNWIAKDPRLQADPGLMNDPTYLRNHPNFATWLQQHPQAHEQVEQMGAYDKNHQWHNRDWYQKNDPDWQRNHPNWANNNYPNQYANTGHPRGEGDYDEHHEWHDRDWYRDHRQEWVKEHHPEWAHDKEKIEAKVHEHEHHDQH
jgi:hypothetical protein